MSTAGLAQMEAAPGYGFDQQFATDSATMPFLCRQQKQSALVLSFQVADRGGGFVGGGCGSYCGGPLCYQEELQALYFVVDGSCLLVGVNGGSPLCRCALSRAAAPAAAFSAAALSTVCAAVVPMLSCSSFSSALLRAMTSTV